MAGMALVSGIYGGKSGKQLEVDPTFMAARIAFRPLDYASEGRVLGHYAVNHRSGSMTGAGALLLAENVASLRWTDSTAYCVLMRIKAGWSVVTAITTAAEMNLGAFIARGFTVDFSSARTLSDLAAIPKANTVRNSMGPSLMGVNGPAIATTIRMTGHTYAVNTNPFAIGVWPSIYSTNVTGTAVLMGVGMAGATQTLYEATALSQHPVVLSQNEGVVIQPMTNAPATDGTFSYYVQWEWAEVEVF